MMKCLAQLGYRRPKYPTLGSKESALKFLSVSLKANNPNKDDEYRQKYSEKLNKFIKECDYSQEIREELERKAKGTWESHDEENLLKLCEEYSQFMKELETTEKTQYFSNFIR
jgi:adenylate/nucleoside-diphosphate kinase